MRRSLLVVAAVAAVALAGCGNAEPTLPVAGPAAAPAQQAPPGVPALTGNPTDLTKASQAQAGTGTPPTELVTQDIVVGTGTAATLSNTVAVRYSGTLYTNGKAFDSSWSRGEAPTSFPLSGVVKGFAQGIAGMQPGGRRVLVIPPALGYGDRARDPIPAGSTLVFVVDLVSIS